jgi:uncharacterized protein (DUF1501 family)
MKGFKLTRRQFLKGSAAAGLAGLAPTLLYTGSARAAGTQNPVLITVHLHGGNDHLNTFIPFTEANYTALRPTLSGVLDAGALPLDDRLMLHPSMTRFKNQYDAGRIAIVQGVGYPEPNRSHFRAIDIYEGADPVGTPDTGWLGRYLDQVGDNGALGGAYIGSAVPLSLAAQSFAAPAVPGIEEYMYQTSALPADGDAQLEAALAIFNQMNTGAVLFDGLLTQDRAAMDSIDVVQGAADVYQSDIVYEDDDFSQNMKVAAQLVNADIGVRVLATELNGFDTHANQLDTQADLLGSISAGLDSFLQDADALGFADRVVVLLFSEFGRRVAENGTAGTDHGTAAPMIVAGNGVNGGIYGDYPDLATLDSNGDLLVERDFREVYATLLGDWLGADAAPILGGDWETIPALLK